MSAKSEPSAEVLAERERCARHVEVLAHFMESGAGPLNAPGSRLRQAARYIREGEKETLWDPRFKEDLTVPEYELPTPRCGHGAQALIFACEYCGALPEGVVVRHPDVPPPGAVTKSGRINYYCWACKDEGCSECDAPDVNDGQDMNPTKHFVHKHDTICPRCGKTWSTHYERHEIGFHCSAEPPATSPELLARNLAAETTVLFAATALLALQKAAQEAWTLVPKETRVLLNCLTRAYDAASPPASDTPTGDLPSPGDRGSTASFAGLQGGALVREEAIAKLIKTSRRVAMLQPACRSDTASEFLLWAEFYEAVNGLALAPSENVVTHPETTPDPMWNPRPVCGEETPYGPCPLPWPHPRGRSKTPLRRDPARGWIEGAPIDSSWCMTCGEHESKCACATCDGCCERSARLCVPCANRSRTETARPAGDLEFQWNAALESAAGVVRGMTCHTDGERALRQDAIDHIRALRVTDEKSPAEGEKR